jgi:hypothetical protein
MDTKKCKQCSEEIKKDAKQCKHCGAKQGVGFLKACGLLCLSLLILIAVSSAVGGDDRDEEPTGSSEEITPTVSYTLSAADLYGEYENNAVAADQKYQGQLVEVSGKIIEIGTEILGKPYVVLGPSDYVYHVQCVFAYNDESTVANLSKGQSVTLQGEVVGQLGWVNMKECRLAE